MVTQLGLTVALSTLSGLALGWLVDRYLLGEGKIGQLVGIFLGLAGGIMGAWRELRMTFKGRGEGE